ncbi:MAG: mechanosensitive ion channel family protein, partial [Epsilonproteobacteria bacterium]|nr:mechanosensitive ion channel family protein [Campylobacterota bacterium]
IIVIINTIVITIAIVVILSIWGINASAFLASLGISGIAFALAAKDTASNIFGSISILADGVIKIGEWIKINSIEGVVETIGMRSTKIRTFDKSLISIPNQVIANAQIENFSRRSVRRMKLKVPLPYSSKSEQILKVIEDIKNMLLRNKSIAQDEKSIVNFENFDNNIILISVATFTNIIDTEHFFRIQQDINIKIMQIIEENALWLAQVEDKK